MNKLIAVKKRRNLPKVFLQEPADSSESEYGEEVDFGRQNDPERIFDGARTLIDVMDNQIGAELRDLPAALTPEDMNKDEVKDFTNALINLSREDDK